MRRPPTDSAEEIADFSTSCQHDLMLRLTRPRDLVALNDAVTDIIGELCPAHGIRLYEYNRPCGGWHPAHGQPDYDTDADVLHIACELQPSVIPADSRSRYRSIFPIASERDLLAALVLEGDPGPINQMMLQVLLTLYANQYFLLNRNKRDGLTDLLNRQALDERLHRIYRQDSCHQRRTVEAGTGSWQLALLDIDHFKRINDGYGHLCGDEVLIRFAQVMYDSFRDYDYLFRYGGEEFVVLLKGVDHGMAHTVLDRFRDKVCATSFPQVGSVTVSIGYTPLNTTLPSASNLNRADQALYAAKGAGRNRVVSYEQLGVAL